MEIALYYAPNTCALAPYVTLTEAGADFVVRPLNFRKRQNFTPAYVKINTNNKVPASSQPLRARPVCHAARGGRRLRGPAAQFPQAAKFHARIFEDQS